MGKCFLCERMDAKDKPPGYGGFFGLECPACGHIVYENGYYITNDKFELYDDRGQKIQGADFEKIKIALRYYYKTFKGKGYPIALERDTWQDIVNSVNYPTSLLDKIDLVVEYIYGKTTYFEEKIKIDFEHNYSLFFCKDSKELLNILNYLKEKELITWSCSLENSIAMITAEGIKKVEQLDKNFNSEQCFVAMWFADEMQNIYDEAIKPSIEGDATLNKEHKSYGAGYKSCRIDDKQHINYINDEMIKEIRRSKFMIADLTGYRGGVYYEAGYACGLGLPVILTCRKDMKERITEKDEKTGDEIIRQEGVHFDLAQKNMILWEPNKLEEFKEALVNRIGSVVGLNEKTKVKISV